MKTILITVLATIVAALAHADKVIGIADGDTLTVIHDRVPLKIRLANIDAPEKRQPFGDRAKQSLSDLCYGKNATYKVQGIDQYGRSIAVVTCAGVEVNRLQIERGYAWIYERYNQDSSLPGLEAAAKRARKGLWADPSPIPPWDFRHSKKSLHAVGANDAECYIGPRGGHFRIINGKKRYGC